jgi:hypothetical protein
LNRARRNPPEAAAIGIAGDFRFDRRTKKSVSYDSINRHTHVSTASWNRQAVRDLNAAAHRWKSHSKPF